MNNGMPMNMPNMNPGMAMPNMDINMGAFATNKAGDMHHVMEKMHHLEHEVKKLNKRVDALEGGHYGYPVPMNKYDDGMEHMMMKDYPQYHSGNYML